MDPTPLFCDIDDFCQAFVPLWRQSLIGQGEAKRNREHGMGISEMITLPVAYHCKGYRVFKWFCQQHVQKLWRPEFPHLLSYNRFVGLIPKLLVPLTAFMASRCDTSQGIAFVDSTSLCVCKNIRIPRHRTFAGEAGRGKSSTGWFYGFKLHLVVNGRGGIVSFCVTPGNTDDRKPVPAMCEGRFGLLSGDQGRIS